MRLPFAAELLALVLLSGVSIGAQQPATSPDPARVPPLPRIGLPLPAIGLPLPTLGLPIPPNRPMEPGTTRERRERRTHRLPPRIVPVYVMPTYVVPPAMTPQTEHQCGLLDCGSAPLSPAGRLRVAIQPQDIGQVYLDGAYVGTAGRGWENLDVEPGPHTIEIRAEGYDTIQDGLLVTAGRTMTFSGTLKARRATEPAALPPPNTATTNAPSTYYVIRGCYAGNVPPAQVVLPQGCDPKLAVAITR